MISTPARFFFSAVYILVAIGIVMTYSSSAVYAEHVYQNSLYFLVRQLLFVAVGTVALWITARLPIVFWENYARAVILFSILLLLMVFVPGIGLTAGGARRWLHLGIVNFQPAEFTKVAVCVYLSDYLNRKMKTIKKGGIFIFIPPLVLIGTICVLILTQPDLGSCAFILAITAILLFLAGLPLRYVMAAGAIFVPIFYFLVIRVPYRLNRVTAYLNPWEDREGSGFQMIQSFLAFGLGGWKGVGLGQSTQKLFYLPSSYNDFILAIIGEELGLLGVLGVLGLFVVIFFCGVRIAARCEDFFGKMLTLSLTLSIVLQALVNMMVATGLLPTKGLPLPFVSYGGTSVVINLLSVGLIMAVDMQKRTGR